MDTTAHVWETAATLGSTSLHVSHPNKATGHPHMLCVRHDRSSALPPRLIVSCWNVPTPVVACSSELLLAGANEDKFSGSKSSNSMNSLERICSCKLGGTHSWQQSHCPRLFMLSRPNRQNTGVPQRWGCRRHTPGPVVRLVTWLS